MSRTCSHLSGKKLLFYATLGTEGADSMVLGEEEKSHVIQKSHQMWPKTRLPAYLLSLQGVRWVQHHQALPEHLVFLLHQQGQGLPGAQQVPEDKHKRSGIRFPPSPGESTGLVCKGSGLRNVSGLGQEGHRGQRQKQLKRKMAWHSSYSNRERRLCQVSSILFCSLLQEQQERAWDGK